MVYINRLKAQIRVEQTGKEELRKILADKEERLRAGDQVTLPVTQFSPFIVLYIAMLYKGVFY